MGTVGVRRLHQLRETVPECERLPFARANADSRGLLCQRDTFSARSGESAGLLIEPFKIERSERDAGRGCPGARGSRKTPTHSLLPDLEKLGKNWRKKKAVVLGNLERLSPVAHSIGAFFRQFSQLEPAVRTEAAALLLRPILNDSKYASEY